MSNIFCIIEKNKEIKWALDGTYEVTQALMTKNIFHTFLRFIFSNRSSMSAVLCIFEKEFPDLKIVFITRQNNFIELVFSTSKLEIQ